SSLSGAPHEDAGRRTAQHRLPRRMTATRRLVAILAADVAGYSRLIGADEGGTLQTFKTIREEVFDPKIAAHHGRLVKTTADGFLAEFNSVADALRSATEVQPGRVEAQCLKVKRARRRAIPPGTPNARCRPLALLLNIMLAGALLCGAGSVPYARAQMHMQSLE